MDWQQGEGQIWSSDNPPSPNTIAFSSNWNDKEFWLLYLARPRHLCPKLPLFLFLTLLVTFSTSPILFFPHISLPPSTLSSCCSVVSCDIPPSLPPNFPKEFLRRVFFSPNLIIKTICSFLSSVFLHLFSYHIFPQGVQHPPMLLITKGRFRRPNCLFF